MPARGENAGFTVVNEIVYAVIPAPGLQRNCGNAESEGMTVVSEIVFDAGAKADELETKRHAK